MRCSCPLPKGKVLNGVSLLPAISRCLKARLYGWLPLSNAYGISFIATPYPIYLYFHVAPHDQSINIFRCAPIPNLSIFPRCNPCPIYQHFPLQNIPPINISYYNSFPIYRHYYLYNPIPDILTFPVAEKQSGACMLAFIM